MDKLKITVFVFFLGKKNILATSSSATHNQHRGALPAPQGTPGLGLCPSCWCRVSRHARKRCLQCRAGLPRWNSLCWFGGRERYMLVWIDLAVGGFFWERVRFLPLSPMTYPSTRVCRVVIYRLWQLAGIFKWVDQSVKCRWVMNDEELYSS